MLGKGRVLTPAAAPCLLPGCSREPAYGCQPCWGRWEGAASRLLSVSAGGWGSCRQGRCGSPPAGGLLVTSHLCHLSRSAILRPQQQEGSHQHRQGSRPGAQLFHRQR